jgi:hypothetical protein
MHLYEPELNFIAHLGDHNYVDNQLNRILGPDWITESTVRDFASLLELLTGDYAQSLAASVAPVWRQWDDHEVKDAWYGSNVDPGLYVKARTAFRSVTKHCRPAAPSVYCGPPQGPTDLETRPGELDGMSPSGEQWSEDDVFYWYTESANTLFVMLDTRTVRSADRGQMLGPTQLAWLLDLIANTDKEIVCLFSQVRWSDGNVNKVNDYWGTSVVADALYVEERQLIIDTFREAKGNAGFLLLLSGDDHMSTATRNFGLGGHPNVYEVLNGGLCAANHQIDDLPSWLISPAGSYQWLTNNGLYPGQTIRFYVVVEIEEDTGVIRIMLKNGNTGVVIGETTVGGTLDGS